MTEPNATELSTSVHSLACLEVRGGNRSGVFGVELPGMTAWVSCSPLSPASRGGDLYYLSACSGGEIARVAIADVAGHGEDVSIAARQLRNALREHVNEWDQSELMRSLNDRFFHSSDEGKSATAFFLSFEAITGELLFTNAGHPPPLWYRSSLRTWTFLEHSTPFAMEIADLPLGMIPGTAYRQTAVPLNYGDLLLLYTDGISESFDDRGEQLGVQGLLHLAACLPTSSAADCGEALVAAADAFRGGAPATDDATVVAVVRGARRTSLPSDDGD